MIDNILDFQESMTNYHIWLNYVGKGCYEKWWYCAQTLFRRQAENIVEQNQQMLLKLYITRLPLIYIFRFFPQIRFSRVKLFFNYKTA
jgi:hypothetical protein